MVSLVNIVEQLHIISSKKSGWNIGTFFRFAVNSVTRTHGMDYLIDLNSI